MLTTNRLPRCSPLQGRPAFPHRSRTKCSSSSKPDNTQATKPPAKQDSSPGLGLKAAWYGAEQLGNIIGALAPRAASTAAKTAVQQAMLSRPDAIAAIRTDYDENYFVSGQVWLFPACCKQWLCNHTQGSLAAYAPDCRFADPFASFRGVQRFKNNVSNLGSLMYAVRCQIQSWI